MKFIKQLVNVGTFEGQEPVPKAKTKLLNRVSITTIVLAFFYMIWHYVLGSNLALQAINFQYMLVGLVSLYLHSRNKLQAARYFISTSYTFAFITTTLCFGANFNLEFFLLIVGVGSALLFEHKRDIYGFAAMSFVSFLSIKLFHLYYPQPLLDIHYPASFAIINACVIFVFLFFFVDSVFKHNKKLILKVKQLNDDLEVKVKQRTMELEDQTKQLEHSNNELKRFAYISSHDMREPLRNILSYSQLVKKAIEKEEYEHIDDYTAFIEWGVKRLDNLTKDVAEYTAIDFEVDKNSTVDFKNLIEGMFAFKMEKFQGVQAKLSISSELRNLKMNNRLANILVKNLLDNAFQYCKTDHLDLRIDTYQKNGKYILTFMDNGIGIPMDYQKDVFKQFKRLSNDLSRTGSGIGLAICKKIMSAYEGDIWVDSLEGEGSVFGLVFPVKMIVSKEEVKPSKNQSIKTSKIKN